MQQALLAVRRVHAHRIHFVYHLHDVLPAMSPTSYSRVEFVGISYTEVGTNDYQARCNKRFLLCIAFTLTVSISCITYTMLHRS